MDDLLLRMYTERQLLTLLLRKPKTIQWYVLSGIRIDTNIETHAGLIPLTVLLRFGGNIRVDNIRSRKRYHARFLAMYRAKKGFIPLSRMGQ